MFFMFFMFFMFSLFNFLNVIGIVAFTISGSEIAIDSGMDVFGVILLGMITSFGGGVIRDITLGIFPPSIFRNYSVLLLSAATAAAVFVIDYATSRVREKRAVTDTAVNLLDAAGLGIFTVTGTQIALYTGMGDNISLLLFAGVCTGVGGGLIRDIIARRTPVIFVKHVYAVASMVGCTVYIILNRIHVRRESAVLVAISVIFIVRLLSTLYKWNLPRVGPRPRH